MNVNQISIFKIPSRTAKARVIYRILEKASINQHTYIALYCKDDLDAKQIRFHLNDFMTSTDKTHDQILNYANLSLGEINNLKKLNDKKLYTFIILPTIIDDAKHDSAYKKDANPMETALETGTGLNKSNNADFYAKKYACSWFT